MITELMLGAEHLHSTRQRRQDAYKCLHRGLVSDAALDPNVA